LEANQVGDTDALSLDIFPELGIGGSRLELNGMMTEASEICGHGPRPDGTDRDLAKEVSVGLEGEASHVAILDDLAAQPSADASRPHLPVG
jgi:hypothetical protein